MKITNINQLPVSFMQNSKWETANQISLAVETSCDLVTCEALLLVYCNILKLIVGMEYNIQS